jgi:hypothetical protein
VAALPATNASPASGRHHVGIPRSRPAPNCKGRRDQRVVAEQDDGDQRRDAGDEREVDAANPAGPQPGRGAVAQAGQPTGGQVGTDADQAGQRPPGQGKAPAAMVAVNATASLAVAADLPEPRARSALRAVPAPAGRRVRHSGSEPSTGTTDTTTTASGSHRCGRSHPRTDRAPRGPRASALPASLGQGYPGKHPGNVASRFDNNHGCAPHRVAGGRQLCLAAAVQSPYAPDGGERR